MSRIKRLSIVFGVLVAAMLALVYSLLSRSKVELWPWHLVVLEEEFTAGMADEVASIADYQELEERLFAEVDAALAPEVESFRRLSRYHPDSPTNPVGFSEDWNRTFELEPDPAWEGEPGGALLLHGLTDSPFSLRHVAYLLNGNGFGVVGLRLPGHGTIPNGINHATTDDWRAAVRLAAGEVADSTAASAPFLLVGYSTGAALALDYALEALEDPELRVPDRLVMLSPALASKGVARLAIWQTRISRLPGLSHRAWHSVLPEYDPFKYNSFPAFAGSQYLRLTERLEKGLARLESAGRLDELPPVLAVQSAVDATVPSLPSLTRLFDRMRFNGSELVLFDANRLSYIEELLNPEVDAVRTWLIEEARDGFSVTVVTNFGTEESEVWALTWRERAGDPETGEPDEIAYDPLGIEWPIGIYSLSHVAVPFPPEDPVYGTDTSFGPPFPFGLVELRGERELLQIPQDLLSRMRYNPFFPYLEERLLSFAAGESWEAVLDREGMFEPADPDV